ncbi:MAG: 3-deoxy-D-manno-octulosonic acid transferase [Alphaproteobacteria bacterium]|nr:3-deoxy-D-manno-octulosonic acid transferase [Alphaproteobacteria bacterium]
MALGLYRGLTTAAEPLIRYYLARRCEAGKEDPDRLNERFGEASCARPSGALAWVHGASVGEAVSALALIDRMLAERPRLNVLVTTGTVTSARLLAKRLPRRAFHQYVPVDHAGWIHRFLDHWRPDLALWMESELWPNLIRGIAAAGTPLVLLNGRMSEASYRRWLRLPFLIRPLLGSFALCLGQDDAQTERLAALGARCTRMVGNLKYAAAPLPADAAELERLRLVIAGRPVWLAASTHPGEERIVADAHRAVAARHPDLLTIIAPRHADRGTAVAQELIDAGLRVACRSAREDPAGRGIYLADTMGELGLFYRLAGIAFVGGSLVPHGGHNPLEPALLGAAVLSGPHTRNFAAVFDEMRAAQAVGEVTDAVALAAAVGALLDDPARRRALAAAAEGVAVARAGVLDAVMDEIGPWLDRAEHRQPPTSSPSAPNPPRGGPPKGSPPKGIERSGGPAHVIDGRARA